MTSHSIIGFADSDNFVIMDNIAYYKADGTSYRDVSINMYPLDKACEMMEIIAYLQNHKHINSPGMYSTHNFKNHTQVYDEKYDSSDSSTSSKKILKRKIALKKKARQMTKKVAKKNGYKDKLFKQNEMLINPYFTNTELEEHVRMLEDRAFYEKEEAFYREMMRAEEEAEAEWRLRSDRDYDDYDSMYEFDDYYDY